MSIQHIFTGSGPLISTKDFNRQQCDAVEIYYHHSQKAECALVAMSSWYGGDVFEFGAHDLCTFRNILTAVHISGMAQAYTDTQFYAFDIFGKLPEVPIAEDGTDMKAYFKPYSDQGDRLEQHRQMIQQHGLFVDRCFLMQGLFKDTCTQAFKDHWRNVKPAGDHSQTALHLAPEHRNPKERQIGFCSIDCNVGYSYQTVFEFIFDMMAENSYIYMDEGLQNPDVLSMWDQFQAALLTKRNMRAVYIRNAAGFGSLWRLYPVVNTYQLVL